MKSFISAYMLERLEYMHNEIKSSTPGSRYWYPSNKPGRTNEYCTTRSTFPDYCKFFYEKPTKEYKLLSEEEKLNNYVFHGNTKELLLIIRKVINNKIRLTTRQLLCIELLYNNFLKHEEDYIEENKCKLL